MSFSPEWLALREPFDHAARSTELAQRFAAALPSEPHLVELGGGTGSGIRWLAPQLQSPHRWTLVDHDPELLACVPAELAATHAHDLRQLPSLDLDVQAVSCQALLDLVDVGFLIELADWLAQRQLPLLAALTVDGRVDWLPADPADAEVGAAFRIHQLTDRGFGASPGTRAAAITADLLTVRGYAVQTASADWQIPSTATDMLVAMIDGTAHAAAEIHPHPEVVEAWRQRRLEVARRGQLSLMVGHTDLLALPR
ncbi:MAG: hypothetical protein KTR31_25730 [Myxococcales bacterium]|nr:hypothetical protein [Myxococcales bacterium]